MTVESVCRAFQIPGRYIRCVTLHTGNINCTFRVTFREEGKTQEYIVQKINLYVFKNPFEIMSNIDAVTEHIKMKIEQGTHRNTDRFVLQFLKTPAGTNYFIGDDGNVWRAYRFIDNSITYDSSEDLTILENAGHAFGQFQKDLMDFDATRIYETIPDFHNTTKRLDTLFAHAREDPYHRVHEVQSELDYLQANRGRADHLMALVADGTIPYRVTHNDTKCNNVLFDKVSGEALAVIDLDTVMPGLIMYDFGDAVRFAANSAAEDESDTTLVSLDLQRYSAFTRGFVSSLGNHITQAELDNMALGAFAITLELASRFLDDYITGDKYFATRYPAHNLDRARCQIALAMDMDSKLDQMQAIVNEAYENR